MTTASERDAQRASSARTTRIVVIALAVLEAILLFGVVVPKILAKAPPAGDRPRETTGATHD